VPAAGAGRKFVVFGALDYVTSQVHWQQSLREYGIPGGSRTSRVTS
jgi:hypothetical protein